MLNYKKLKTNRRRFLALTGLTPKEFRLLLPVFERAYKQQYLSDKTLVGKARKRKAGGGRRGPLDSPAQKLLFVLVYLKAYPLQELLVLQRYFSWA